MSQPVYVLELHIVDNLFIQELYSVTRGTVLKLKLKSKSKRNLRPMYCT